MHRQWEKITYAIYVLQSSRPSDAYMRQLTTIIDSDNGLSPGQLQAIICTEIVDLTLI